MVVSKQISLTTKILFINRKPANLVNWHLIKHRISKYISMINMRASKLQVVAHQTKSCRRTWWHREHLVAILMHSVICILCLVHVFSGRILRIKICLRRFGKSILKCGLSNSKSMNILTIKNCSYQMPLTGPENTK